MMISGIFTKGVSRFNVLQYKNIIRGVTTMTTTIDSKDTKESRDIKDSDKRESGKRELESMIYILIKDFPKLERDNEKKEEYKEEKYFIFKE